jgi:hypothetical protein
LFWMLNLLAVNSTLTAPFLREDRFSMTWLGVG